MDKKASWRRKLWMRNKRWVSSLSALLELDPYSRNEAVFARLDGRRSGAFQRAL